MVPIATKLRATWQAAQVELHGKYSVQRLLAFKRYSMGTTTRRAVRELAVLLVFPLPGLVLVVLPDLWHLPPPADGWAANYRYWLRSTLTGWLVSFMLLEQMRAFIPDLHARHAQLACMATLVSVGGTAQLIAVANVIGFPVPFGPLAGSPAFMGILLSSVWFFWGARFRESEQLRLEAKQFLVLINLQCLLTVIYPAFYLFFAMASHAGQMALTAAFPMLKILLKCVFAAIMQNLPDWRPAFVVFNMELFHSLFMACCMQTSASGTTAVLVMVMDALHSCMSIYDVDSQVTRIKAALAAAGRPMVTLPSLVDSAIYLLRDSATLRDVVDTREGPMWMQTKQVEPRRAVSTNVVVPVASTTYRPASIGIERTSRPLAISTESTPADGVAWNASALFSFRRRVAGDLVVDDLPLRLHQSEMQLLDGLAHSQRVACVNEVLVLLHLTEFVMLVEYVEVVTPVVYATFTTTAYYLSNRAYYLQLATMDPAAHQRVVENVLRLAGLEFLSLVVLAVVVRRQIRFEPLRQVAFVLSTQWNTIQAVVSLWLVYAVHLSLEHVGVDYSFQFKWLHS